MKKNKISKNWVNKQRRDIYVRQSKVDGYRARSAYKLIEIEETVAGTVTHKWFRCKHKDGTIYPCRHDMLREI